MTAPRIQRERLTPKQHQAMRDEGYSDDEISAEYDLPEDGALTRESLAKGRRADVLSDRPAAKPPNLKDWGMVLPKALGKAALMSAQSVPVLGPAATRAAGLQDELAEARDELGPLGTIGEIAQGVAAGGQLFKMARALPSTGRAAKLAKLATGGSRNTGAGVKNALKRLGTNVGVGGVIGGTHGGFADADDPGRGVAVGTSLGMLGGALPSVVSGTKNLSKWGAEKVRPALVAMKELRDLSKSDMVNLATAIQRARPGETLGDIAGTGVTSRIRTALADHTREATRALKRIAAREPTVQQVENAFTAGTGARRVGVTGQQAAIETARQPAIGQRYAAAYEGTPEVVDETTLRMLRHNGLKVPRKVVDARYKAMGQSVPGSKIKGNPVGMRHPVTLEYIDEVMRAAKKIGDGQPTRLTVMAKEGKDLLTEAAENAHPDFREARQAAAEKLSMQDAAVVGAAAGKGKDVRDLAVEIDRVAPKGSMATGTSRVATRESAREAIGQELRHRLAGTSSAKGAVDFLADDRNSREVVEAAFDSPKKFQKFERRMGDLMRTATRNAALQGNESALRLINDDAFGVMTPWGIAQALKGAPQLAASQALGGFHKSVTKRVEGKTGRLLAGMSMTPLRNPNGELSVVGKKLLADLTRRRQIVLPKRATWARVQGGFRRGASHDPEQE